jgi:tRNA pseudouridine38-40 synthase
MSISSGRSPPFRLADGLNAKLRPLPVAIVAAREVPGDWHAAFSCIGRRYVYRIENRRAPLALEAGRAWRVPVVLHADAMNHARRYWSGGTISRPFRSAHCQAESPVKTLDRLGCGGFGTDRNRGGGALIPPPSGAIDGRCLELVGRGKWSERDLKSALQARDRAALGFNAPPDGLYFAEATYEREAEPWRLP